MTQLWTGAGFINPSADADIVASFLNADRFLGARVYGVVGNGTTDDTAAAQSAFTAGASQKKIVYFGSMIVKLTAAITCSGPGFMFDAVPHGDSGGPGFLVTGTGYTALTISSQPTTIQGTVRGTGNAANGVLFQNPILSQVQKLRVHNLDGYGIKINRCWDCTFHDLSVELCGNATDYAFSVNDDGDTSNMSHFGRIQAETCKRKAIYISPTALSCVFDNIHSEGITDRDAGTLAYVLGGSSCLYNGMRISAPASNCMLRMESFHSTYIAARIEATVDVELEGWSSSGITLIAPWLVTAHERSGQAGKITIVGGLIGTWTGNKTARTCYNTTITTDS